MSKVLILSHNPISTHQSMGKTFLSLFNSFESKDLCQLYIYPSLPDVDVCNSYFRITDKGILKSYFKFKADGREISKSEILATNNVIFENPNDEEKYRNKKNKQAFRMILRDMMWRFAPWYSANLKKWLLKEKPEVIFVAPGDAKFIYNMALKISKEFKIPIVTYVCDEYYFVKKPNDILGKIRVFCLKKKIKQLICKTSHIVTICEELKQVYSKGFSVPATVIMTGTSYSLATSPLIKKDPKSITYMGNIRCNRFNSLAEIGRELKKLNNQKGTDFSLNIYTAEKDESVLNALKGIDTIKLCGYVSGNDFYRVFHNADMLLHTEAFDEKSIDSVKNSVSTKIADSLASGIPLLAYGPKEVASMQHLIDNKCAIVATKCADLKTMLETAFFDTDVKKATCENALMTAKKFHNSVQNSKRLYSIMEKINEGITS